MFESLMLILGSLLGVVFLSLLERKILSMVQMRVGPNKVLLGGLLQSVIDAMKLFSKEQMKLLSLTMIFYMMNCVGLVILSLILWVMIPISTFKSDFMLGSLILVMILGLETYFLLFMGWMSSNKFSMLGGLRGVSVVVSYEVVFFLLILSFIFFLADFSMTKMMKFQNWLGDFNWEFWFFFSLMMMIFLSEMNRSPMDLTEGESELVSGFNIEYMAYSLSLVFISEFSKMIIMMIILVSFLKGSEMYELGLSFSLLLLLIRATYPRFRYDHLMGVCWKMMLPMIMGLFMLFMLY